VKEKGARGDVRAVDNKKRTIVGGQFLKPAKNAIVILAARSTGGGEQSSANAAD
jgi:hypothetical protein